MKFQPTIDVLLRDGCPSIQYRVRTEILGDSPTSSANRNLQKQILDDPLVKAAFSWQLPNGHFGATLTDDMMRGWDMLKIAHGKNGFEQALKILHEKGVDPTNSNVVRGLAAIDALPSSRIDNWIGIAHAHFGMTDNPHIHRAVADSLGKFERISVLDSMDEIVGRAKKRVFKRGVLWPDVYDLDVLAYTHEWRTASNQGMMRAAIQKIAHFYPEPEDVYGQAPKAGAEDKWSVYGFAWFKLTPSLPTAWYQRTRTWFNDIEHLSRMAFLTESAPLRGLVESLMAVLDKGNGWFTEAVEPRSFTRWTRAYDGMALEDCNYLKSPYGWLSEDGRIRDLTFRCLLILSNFRLLT